MFQYITRYTVAVNGRVVAFSQLVLLYSQLRCCGKTWQICVVNWREFLNIGGRGKIVATAQLLSCLYNCVVFNGGNVCHRSSPRTHPTMCSSSLIPRRPSALCCSISASRRARSDRPKRRRCGPLGSSPSPAPERAHRPVRPSGPSRRPRSAFCPASRPTV